MSRTGLSIATLVLTLALAPAAFAQQSDMRGMDMQNHSKGSMEMRSMMNQCAHMRQQMQAGAQMSSDM